MALNQDSNNRAALKASKTDKDPWMYYLDTKWHMKSKFQLNFE